MNKQLYKEIRSSLPTTPVFSLLKVSTSINVVNLIMTAEIYKSDKICLLYYYFNDEIEIYELIEKLKELEERYVV